MERLTQVNPNYLYDENDIYEVLDAHVRDNNLQYAVMGIDGRIAFTDSLFRASDGQLKDGFQYETALIIDRATNAPYYNERAKTITVCAPMGYDAGPADIYDAAKNNLIRAWDAEHVGHEAINNIQAYPYHINANHWGFGSSDSVYPYYDPIGLGHQSQGDGSSCGVISAEYGKNVIIGRDVGNGLIRPIAVGAETLRRQHIDEVGRSLGPERKNNLLYQKQHDISNKKSKKSSKPKEEPKQQEPEPKSLPNRYRDEGLTNHKIDAPDLSGDSASSSSSLPKTEKKVQGKLPRVRYAGDYINPAQDLDDVRELVRILYNNKGIGADINKRIEENLHDFRNPDVIAGLHALCEDLKKVHVAKYKGNNLLRELKEAQLAEDDPKSFGKGLNTLIKNRRMGVDENIGVDSISPLKLLISGWNRGWKEASLSGGTKKERDFLTNNTIHRVITAPIPAQEKRLIKNMLEASNREADYYENSIKNLIEHGLVLDEKTFEISKPLTLAKEITHNVGDALNWVGQGIFAPPTRPEETRTWQKHAEYRNKLLQNYYKNLNPDRDGAFRIKYRELLQQGFSNSFYNQLLNEKEFNEMVEIVKKYADEQETEKFRNLDQLEKNLTDANEKILGKAEEIALKEDEIWKYKMLQMVIAFSPLAPLNVLNHIGDIIAPIKDFLDLFGVDTVIDWLLHDSPLKFVTETFDFAKDSVSPILNSASNLSDSPIAGLIIDGVAGLVLTDKWTELSILKKQANEESKKLNKNHLKTANESVEKYENSKITEYAKKVVSTLDGIIKKGCGGNEKEIKNAYFNKAKELGIPHDNLVRELQSEGFKEDDVSIYNLVKEHCTRTGADFQSLYGPKAKKGSIDIATSSSNENSPKKPITANDFSEEEKDKIRERAKELKEIYSQQEDRDIEQIQRYIEKYVKDRFNRSGTSRPAPDPDKNLLKLTDDTVPKTYDIKSRSDEEKFKSAKKTLLEQATNTKKLVGGGSMMA